MRAGRHKRHSCKRPKAVFPAKAIFCFAALLLVALIISLRFRPAAPKETVLSEELPRVQTPRPLTLEQILSADPTSLQNIDIAVLNLACAQGLSGSENIDIRDSLARLDGIAQRVKQETFRHSYKFRDNPARFDHSLGFFRMLMLAVVLQEDLGMRYNPARITTPGQFEPNNVFFADSKDVFLHGLISDDRRMGTCSSMPVLYVAVGRRLGYPVSLVPTRNHLFVRWEDANERFNVDATTKGLNRYNDDHYRQWPLPVSLDEEREFGLLRSMTPADELASFLTLRGHCLMAAGRTKEALATHQAALRVVPQSKMHEMLLAFAEEEASARDQALSYLPPDYALKAARNMPAQLRPNLSTPLVHEPNPLTKIR